MKKYSVFIVFVLLLSLCINVLANENEPPGTWPVGHYLCYVSEREFQSFMMHGVPQYSGIQTNAVQGAISPDRKYISYVYKGPYLIVQEFDKHKDFEHWYEDEDGETRQNYPQVVYKIPWGIKPVWSLEGEYLYFTKIDEIKVNTWLSYETQVMGLFRLCIESGEKLQLTNETDTPTSICLITGNLYFQRITKDVDQLFIEDGHQPFLSTYNVKTGEITMKNIFARHIVISPDGTLVYSEFPGPIIESNIYDIGNIYNVPKGSMGYIVNNDKRRNLVTSSFSQANSFNKTGSFFFYQQLRIYSRVDPREPVTDDERNFHWSIYYIDMNNKSRGPQPFLANNFTAYNVNFRYFSNEFVFTANTFPIGGGRYDYYAPWETRPWERD